MLCMAVFEVDLENARILFYHVKTFSEKCRTGFSYDYEKFLEEFAVHFVCENDRREFCRTFHIEALRKAGEEGQENINLEFRINGCGGMEERWLNVGLMLSGDTNKAAGAVMDVQEKKLRELKMQHQISHDALTGLLNRESFEWEVFAGVHKRAGAYCLLDVDNFKVINDTRGHNYGDKVLKHMADILKASVPGDAMVARYGGDEFCIFFPGLCTEEQVGERLEIIFANMKRMEDSHEVSVSVGVAFCTSDCFSREEVERHADVALYKVKESGKNAFAVYRARMGDFCT